MRRLVSNLLALAIASMSGQMSGLHIHDYADHDHPEHHHGPAAHQHPPVHAHANDGIRRLTSCDPGEHAMSVLWACVAVPHVWIATTGCGDALLVSPLTPSHPTSELRDVRVHGPPPLTHAPPRAPPLIAHI